MSDIENKTDSITTEQAIVLTCQSDLKIFDTMIEEARLDKEYELSYPDATPRIPDEFTWVSGYAHAYGLMAMAYSYRFQKAFMTKSLLPMKAGAVSTVLKTGGYVTKFATLSTLDYMTADYYNQRIGAFGEYNIDNQLDKHFFNMEAKSRIDKFKQLKLDGVPREGMSENIDYIMKTLKHGAEVPPEIEDEIKNITNTEYIRSHRGMNMNDYDVLINMSKTHNELLDDMIEDYNNPKPGSDAALMKTDASNNRTMLKKITNQAYISTFIDSYLKKNITKLINSEHKTPGPNRTATTYATDKATMPLQPAKYSVHIKQ